MIKETPVVAGKVEEFSFKTRYEKLSAADKKEYDKAILAKIATHHNKKSKVYSTWELKKQWLTSNKVFRFALIVIVVAICCFCVYAYILDVIKEPTFQHPIG